MSVENKKLVLRYYEEVLNGRHEDRLGEFLAPGFRSRFGDLEVGFDGYRQAVHRSLSVFPDLRVQILDQVAEGDLVATRWKASGTMGGRRIEVSAMHFHRVVDGLLVDHWEELDPARFASAPSDPS